MEERLSKLEVANVTNGKMVLSISQKQDTDSDRITKLEEKFKLLEGKQNKNVNTEHID